MRRFSMTVPTVAFSVVISGVTADTSAASVRPPMLSVMLMRAACCTSRVTTSVTVLNPDNSAVIV